MDSQKLYEALAQLQKKSPKKPLAELLRDPKNTAKLERISGVERTHLARLTLFLDAKNPSPQDLASYVMKVLPAE